MPALRDEPADVGGYHRHREHEDSGPGARSSANVPAAGTGTSISVAWPNGEVRDRWAVRAVQNDPQFRQHRLPPGMARVSGVSGSESIFSDVSARPPRVE